MKKKVATKKNDFDLTTVTKSELVMLTKLMSMQTLANMTDNLSQGDFVEIKDLARKNPFLNGRSISGYFSKGKTLEEVNGRKMRKTKKLITKKYVNVEDETDIITTKRIRKGYEVIQ